MRFSAFLVVFIIRLHSLVLKACRVVTVVRDDDRLQTVLFLRSYECIVTEHLNRYSIDTDSKYRQLKVYFHCTVGCFLD